MEATYRRTEVRARDCLGELRCCCAPEEKRDSWWLEDWNPLLDDWWYSRDDSYSYDSVAPAILDARRSWPVGSAAWMDLQARKNSENPAKRFPRHHTNDAGATMMHTSRSKGARW